MTRFLEENKVEESMVRSPKEWRKLLEWMENLWVEYIISMPNNKL